MKLFVTVKARARENAVQEIDRNHFRVSVKAAPIDGKANIAVARALAVFLGIAASRLTLCSGAIGKHKVFDYYT